MHGIIDGIIGVRGSAALSALSVQRPSELSDDDADGGHREYHDGRKHLHLASSEMVSMSSLVAVHMQVQHIESIS